MITLQPITEENYLQAAALTVGENQRTYVASPLGILARAYAYRNRRAAAWGVYEGGSMVGLALLEDLEDEPSCYHLSELLIDWRAQGKGYGSEALALLLNLCRQEGKFPAVEVCVKRENAAAIHVYQKAGFRDTGYVDPATPDSLNLRFDLREACHGA